MVLASRRDEDSVNLLGGFSSRCDEYDVDMELLMKEATCPTKPRLFARLLRRQKKRPEDRHDDSFETAFLSEDDFSWFQPSTHHKEQLRDFHIVWPETLSLAGSAITSTSPTSPTSSRKHRATLLHSWKARMSRSLTSVRFRGGDRRNDEDEAEKNKLGASYITLDDDDIGLYVDPSEAVETVLHRDGRFEATTFDELCVPALEEVHKQNCNESNRMAGVDTRNNTGEKQPVVVEYDEWHCAQLALDDHPMDETKENIFSPRPPVEEGYEVKYISRGVVVTNDEWDQIHAILSNASSDEEDRQAEGIEVEYRPCSVDLDDEEWDHIQSVLQDVYSDDEEKKIFLNPPTDHGAEVTYDYTRRFSLLDRDDGKEHMLHIESSTSQDTTVLLKEESKPLGAQFSHPAAYSQPAVLESYSSGSDKRREPLGICHPPWQANKKRGATVEEMAKRWDKVNLRPRALVPADVSNWSCGLAWSSEVDDDDASDITVSDAGEYQCTKEELPAPRSTFLSSSTCGAFLTGNAFPYDECDEAGVDDSKLLERTVAERVQELVKNKLYHTDYHAADTKAMDERATRRERPECACVKCSVMSMYANLGI